MREQPIFPPIHLGHLEVLLTPLGIWQHTRYGTPAPEHGFSIDDQARGLIVAAWLQQLPEPVADRIQGGTPGLPERLAQVCLNYIEAAQLPDGRFHNFRAADGEWLDEAGSNDSFGRTIWGLKTYVRLFPQTSEAERIHLILERADERIPRLTSPRAIAFALLEEDKRSHVRILGRRLADLYRETRDPAWRWFEAYLTYENPRLPQAMLRSAGPMANPDWLEIGREALEFLLEETFTDSGYFLPIGQDGWYHRGSQRARFDQQPVDAGATVEVCLDAWQIFNYHLFLDYAHRALEWYHGNNSLQQPLYDPSNGVVYDGITASGVNLNRGAESILSYLLARLKWEILAARTAPRPAAHGR